MMEGRAHGVRPFLCFHWSCSGAPLEIESFCFQSPSSFPTPDMSFFVPSLNLRVSVFRKSFTFWKQRCIIALPLKKQKGR